eukprot:14658122-Alexandrium_andersonii.AAC.1
MGGPTRGRAAASGPRRPRCRRPPRPGGPLSASATTSAARRRPPRLDPASRPRRPSSAAPGRGRG